MKNLQKAMKLAHDILNEYPTITYKNHKFRYTCGKQNLKTENLEEVEDYIMQRLYTHWLEKQFNNEEIAKPKTSVKKKIKADSVQTDTKTRQEWSRGKAGDPRRKPNANRKTKRFTKTEVVNCLRQKTNGKFSSEKITREQYNKEFVHENLRAEQRRHWRMKNGKKSNSSLRAR
jgi:hypothetical protein